MPRVAVVLLAAVALTALPAGAAAQQRCQAPAGTSGIDQYCEVVPGPEGDRDAGPGGGPTISGGTTAALARQGADGEALARALGGDPTAANSSGPGDRGEGSAAAAERVVVPDTPGANPFSAVTRAVGGDTVLGSGFFLGLFGVVLVMLGSAWVGWRRSKTAA